MLSGIKTHNVRLIGRLDIKQNHVIKGVCLEGWRKVGNPDELAAKYYNAGVDEILYMDVVASLYGRNNLTDIVKRAAAVIFVPLCVGGGIRTVGDAEELLRAGADKIALNTAAIAHPQLISELASSFGSQAVVLSIEAKRTNVQRWEAYTDNGREKSGIDVVEWAKRASGLGAGELFVTSVDNDGTRRGMDVELIGHLTEVVDIPVIAGGGAGSISHVVEAVDAGGADAVALGSALHFDLFPFETLRQTVSASGYTIRGR